VRNFSVESQGVIKKLCQFMITPLFCVMGCWKK